MSLRDEPPTDASPTDGAALPTGQTPLQLAPFSELTTRRLGPVRRYFVRHPVAMDLVVMAIFLGSAVLASVVTAVGSDGERGHALIALGACTVGTGVLLWRRRAPVIVSTVIVALFVAAVALTGSTAGFELALAFVVYAVAASRSTFTAWSVLLASLAATSFAVWRWIPAGEPMVDQSGQQVDVAVTATTVVSLAIVALVALAIGTSVRNRRLYVADLVERANALARDRDQQAQLARAGERSRIAREMHDVVAHSLSVMITLADGAGAALERSPDKARTALGELSDTGRAALADMRRVLGVLDSADAPLEPQPRSPDLSELVDRFRAAGLSVRTQGLQTTLPDDTGLRLAVYRIVQESLTNVLRHAPGTPGVELSMVTDADAVTIEVLDHGSTTAAVESLGTGRGLIGMRERVGVYGGDIEAGPWGDGWRVRAVLPWRKDDS